MGSTVSVKQGLPSRQQTTLAKWTDLDKERLAKALGQVCSVQNAYGKTSADFPAMIAAFSWALREFAVDDVIRALGLFMQQSPNLPTPFHIVQILKPPPKEIPFDKPYYVHLKKLRQEEGPFALSDEEEAYVKRYESQFKETP